ncbi:MAG TPA: type IV toxin-antitoxin system AbiEi family antitoxin domain-containing protein [Gemmataceae bacterium]|nr:type IV toxin-antitoxin system AbiEi family antitoxin domain-containing protein [Gemmataceae bacterium]
MTRRLEWLPATFRTAEAELAGLWRRELNRLRDEGRLLERSRGVYRKFDAAETAHLDLLGVAHRPPHCRCASNRTISRAARAQLLWVGKWSSIREVSCRVS